MSTNNHSRRIETLENFMQKLTLGSYIAKAASVGESVLGQEPTEGDTQLAGAVTGDVRMNKFENRLNKIERFTQNLYDELIGAPREPAGERKTLDTLAKAQSATMRKNTPEGLLARAQGVLNDPTAVGVVQGYISAGQLAKAAQVLEAAETRADQGDEDVALEKMEGQLKNHELMVTVSELGEKMANFETTMNSLLARLSRLEKPQSAPVQEAVVAKAHGKKQRQETDYRDSVNGLLERAQGVIDSPSLVGQIGSMLQSGDAHQIAQARRSIEAAEIRHESQIKTRDRRSL